MIEQTELVVSKWQYQPPLNSIEGADDKLTSFITLDVMKKRTITKKGIACRFTVEFFFEKETVLEYVTEDSYVIDLPDVIDGNELHTMLRNSYSKCKEKFDFRKLSTVLVNASLPPFDETKYDMGPILLLLH
jgi:hypothetical protein